MFKLPNKLPTHSKISSYKLKEVVNQLIDIIKRVSVRGDSKTIKVTQTISGTTISVINPNNTSTGSSGGGAGFTLLWAKIKSNADSNNYTADIYLRDSTSNTLKDSDVDVYVFDIIDTIDNNSYIPVVKSGGTYYCIQQIGVI